MSIFEDLIDELKNENLLEETIIDLKPAEAPSAVSAAVTGGQAVSAPAGILELEAVVPTSNSAVQPAETQQTEQEFFRKRAMEEVSGLQMVEHVFCGIEREHLEADPRPFDDLNAKKALHKFLQVSTDPSSREHAEAEFALRHETETWSLALAERDQKFAVSNIRRFCDESRPVLSSSALIALGRFYRNSPYSEDVRGKFDYIMTRLFSRESEDGRRAMLFDHNEMIGHINKLYADWSSIALYTSSDDSSEIELTLIRFEEFILEIEQAGTFGELLGSDFFNRLRTYKEESAEMFYVPVVLAAAMKCNLVVGNRYVELIALERNARSAAKVEERYGSEFDHLVSNAAGKTLALTDVLSLDVDVSAEEKPKRNTAIPALAPQAVKPKPQPLETEKADRFDLLGVNRWLAAICVLVILAGTGVFVWAERFAGGNDSGVAMAKPVEIDVADAGKYLKNARLTNETLYAITQPSFDTLTESEKKELLAKVQKFATSKNMVSVALLNKEGRTIAFASKSRLELVPQ